MILNNSNFEVSLNFIPTIPQSSEMPYVKLLSDFKQEIYINSENSVIAKIENIQIVANTGNQNILKGKIKLQIK